MKRKEIQKKEEKEKAKARNEEIGTNEQAVAHPPTHLSSSSAAHIPCPHNTASSLDALHKHGIRPRAFLRQTGLHVAFLVFEVPHRLTGQTGSIALALTSSLYSPLVISYLLYVSMISISPSTPYQTPHLPAIHGAQRHSSCSSHCLRHADTGITPQDQIPDQS